MNEPDWADRAARLLMVEAYSNPNATDVIANALRLAWLRGQLHENRECQKIMNPERRTA